MRKFTLKAQNLLFNSPIEAGQSPQAKLWQLLIGKKVLVAFSGGKDSLALLAYMLEHQAACGWELLACHINHHLRGEESLRDEAFCKQWCAERGVTYFCYEDAVTRDDRGIEAAARSLRYALLHECAIDHGADYVATAHTASDQLESFFVDLLTGTSVFTLGGIAGSCEYISDGIKLVGDVRLIRPLLDVSTDMVNEYLAAKGLAAVYDSTNSDTRYVRNFVRTKLLPALDTRTDALKATVASIQEESRLLADYFDRQTAHFVSLPAEGGVIISRAQLDSAELVLQRYILGKWVSILARGGAMHVCAILRQLQEPRSVRIDLPQGHFCEITPRAVRIFDRSLVQPFEYAAAEAYGLSEHVRASAEIVRSRQNGDRYRGKKLKDLFEQRKLDLYERDRAMVAVAMGEIIWVEHIDG